MKLLYAITLLTLFFSCTSSSNKNRISKTSEEVEAAPDNWFYQQRAYPFQNINYQVYNQAAQQLQEQRKVKQLESRTTTSDWESVGPVNIGGRVTDIALNPNDPNIFFVGTAVGGIFKTTNRGQSWKAVFDDAGRLSIGSIAIAPSNTRILYAGTGEANASATSGAFFGDGVYKSINGGKSWENVGLKNSHHIGRVVVNPNNENHVLIAAMGSLYDKNEERGLYQSKDGGENWEQLFFISDSTSCVDVVMNPVDTNIVYAVMWERIRKPWGRSYAGPTSSIFRTKDGGSTWEELKTGLPFNNGDRGRIGLTMAPSDPNILYASFTKDPVTNDFNGLYKSIDGGDTWKKTNDFFLNGMYSTFGWYFGNLRVNPRNPDDAFILGVSLQRTQSGGGRWDRIADGVHVDHHALEMHPTDSTLTVLGNDGGVYVSSDEGDTWTHLPNLPITQFYECEVSQSEVDHYYGGTQDNGTVMVDNGKSNNWRQIWGGDGFHVVVDPESSDIVYAEYQWGRFFRSINGGDSFQWAMNGIVNSDRKNWNTPFVIDPNNSAILYYGANRLYRSRDRAATWEVISEDLTKGKHESGTNRYGTITTINVSPADSDIIYVGTDDGNVQVTRDGGTTWRLASTNLPNRYVTSVICDFDDPLKAYVTFSGYRKNDYLSHVFMTTNGGMTWEDISDNLPEVPVNDLIIDDQYPAVLYVATDLGVWRRNGQNAAWEQLGTTIPNTVVTDLVIHKRKRELVAATFGRSLYKYKLNFSPPDLPEVDTIVTPFRVYPNPIRDVATIKVEASRSQKVRISMRNLRGRIVWQKENVWLEKGENEIVLDQGQALENGNYVVSVEMEEGVQSEVVKIIK
ncbi:MAG: T9SS type A sorting domain-containing protein [Bacteroidota bacterium]